MFSSEDKERKPWMGYKARIIVFEQVHNREVFQTAGWTQLHSKAIKPWCLWI